MTYCNISEKEAIYYGYCIVDICNHDTGNYGVCVYGFDDYAVYDAENDTVIRDWGFVLRLGEFGCIDDARRFIRDVLVVS